MAKRLTFLLALVLASGLAAQENTLRALSNIGLVVKDGKGGTLLKYIPSGTIFHRRKNAYNLLAYWPPTYMKGISTTIAVTPSRPTTYYLMARADLGTGFTGGTTSDKNAKQAVLAPQSFLLTPPAAANRMTASFNGVANDRLSAGASYWVAINAGASGNVRWDADPTGKLHTQRFLIGTSSKPVRIDIFCSGGAVPAKPSYLYGSLTVDFDCADDPGKFTSYGSSCGPVFGGTDQVKGCHHTLSLSVTGAFALSPIVLLVGDRQLSVPIPGTKCLLLANPLAMMVVSANSRGQFFGTFGLKGPLSGVIHAQAIPVGLQPTRVLSSNGLRIDWGR